MNTHSEEHNLGSYNLFCNPYSHNGVPLRLRVDEASNRAYKAMLPTWDAESHPAPDKSAIRERKYVQFQLQCIRRVQELAGDVKRGALPNKRGWPNPEKDRAAFDGCTDIRSSVVITQQYLNSTVLIGKLIAKYGHDILLITLYPLPHKDSDDYKQFFMMASACLFTDNQSKIEYHVKGLDEDPGLLAHIVGASLGTSSGNDPRFDAKQTEKIVPVSGLDIERDDDEVDDTISKFFERTLTLPEAG